MVYLTNILFLVLGLIIGYPIGLWFSKKKTTDLLSSGTGRFGIVSLHNKKLWKDLHVDSNYMKIRNDKLKKLGTKSDDQTSGRSFR